MSGAPLIGISPNAFPAEERRFYKHKPLEYGDASMAIALRRAGAIPVMLYRAGATAATAVADHARAVISRVEGLLLSGGSDVSPTSYGEEPLDDAWRGQPERDQWEIALYRAAIAAGVPVLGVCRGVQLINVAEGGTLWQDLVSFRPGSAVHRCQDRYCALSHDVHVEPDSELHGLFGDDIHHVNSVHHQGLKDVAPALRVVARAEDGVVEAVERAGAPWVVGVQWHPEWMADRESQERIFQRFVARAREAS